MRPEVDALEADAKVADYLALADRAMKDGKFEKAFSYVELAKAWQTERDRAERRLSA